MESVVAIVVSAVGIWSAAMLYGAVGYRTESRAVRRIAAMMSLGLAFVVVVAIWVLGLFVSVQVPIVAAFRYLLIAIGAVVLMDAVYFGPDDVNKSAEAPTSEPT
jgi:hypothetical protein